MEEVLQLLRENNQMLKYICAHLISQDSVAKQDTKNFIINMVADLLVDNLGNRNR